MTVVSDFEEKTMFKYFVLSALTALVAMFATASYPVHVYMLASTGWVFLSALLYRIHQVEKRNLHAALQAMRAVEAFVKEIERSSEESRTVEGESK